MLYKRNNEKELDKELFRKPTAEYKATPFWAWNGALEKEELLEQIDIFNEMGYGGFHMHVRTGLETQYLSEEFMSLIRACTDKAKENKMLSWLYDEDRWPSGAAGGLVTKDKKYRARSLCFSPEKIENGEFFCAYDIKLSSDGYLEEVKAIGENEEAENDKWYAYVVMQEESGWHNNQTYIDVLNKEAVLRFIEVTHEKYKECVGDEFGETVPAIFTDEPQFMPKGNLASSFDKTAVSMPWTDMLPKRYTDAYGEDIKETLPEIFFEKGKDEISSIRYRYHNLVTEMFCEAFADTIGDWCEKNGIASTGHLMEECTLERQSRFVGEAMRSYRSFQLPGIDMLCNAHEFLTAKQTQSAVHQYGREGMMSELDGVTGWDADFRLYKHHGDWQACLGVTVRVPHLAWYTMKGEAKRDYPASISYQSPWYKEYTGLEDHFSRVNTAMTRGKPVIKVGVIHPIESLWLHWGPNDKTAALRQSIDEKFDSLTKWLLEGNIDFDYISEALLPQLCKEGSNPLRVGEMEYDTIIVPGCETLRRTTLERLSSFSENGGKLIFVGNAPTHCDAVKTDEIKPLYDKSLKVSFSRSEILSSLEDMRTVSIRYNNGRLTDKYIYQLRRDEGCSWLFIAPMKEPKNKDVDSFETINITVCGEYSPEIYDTQSGEIKPCPVSYESGRTVIKTDIFSYDSLLLRLGDGKEKEVPYKKYDTEFEEPYFGEVDYSLSEENVLLLDMAEYKLDIDEEFSPVEELLRLDTKCRDRLSLLRVGERIAQPYIIGKKKPGHTLTLRFMVRSDIDYEGAFLAIEEPESADIIFNGEKVCNEPCGWFCDKSIKKLKMPKINKGENSLVVTLPFGDGTYTEWMYILGEFGVECRGRMTKIIEKPEKITFGSLINQGFPFYSGEVTYKFKASTESGRLKIAAPFYRGAVIKAKLDGEDIGRIIYPPYFVSKENLEKGEHEIELTLFTHRYNTFGGLHLVRTNEYYGPRAWRTVGNNWSYEYIFRESGILASPKISDK